MSNSPDRGSSLKESLTNIESRLNEALKSEAGVATAYLFGSVLTGAFGPESDVDLGLLFFPQQEPEPLEVLEIEHRLSCAVGIEVDVVVLNSASSVIGMQVLRKGKKLLERDSRLDSEFFVRCVNLYADLKRIRAPIEQHLLDSRIFAT